MWVYKAIINYNSKVNCLKCLNRKVTLNFHLSKIIMLKRWTRGSGYRIVKVTIYTESVKF